MYIIAHITDMSTCENGSQFEGYFSIFHSLSCYENRLQDNFTCK